MLNTSAEANPETTNPSTNQAQSMIIRALITKTNNPKVSTVTGIAKSLMIGLMKVLSTARTSATTNSVTMPPDDDSGGSDTPGVIHAEMPMAAHDNIKRNNVLISFLCVFRLKFVVKVVIYFLIRCIFWWKMCNFEVYKRK